jgi:hypothetical protein
MLGIEMASMQVGSPSLTVMVIATGRVGAHVTR